MNTAPKTKVESETDTDSELPEGWAEVTLSQVGVLTTGNTPPKSQPKNFGTKYPWVKPPNLDRDEPIARTTEFLSEQGASLARLLPLETVMVSCIGNLGKVGIAGRELATNQQINSITFTPGLVSPRYGFHYCKTLKSWLEENASATTIAIVNKGKFAEAPFLLAPFAEQERISGTLDFAFTTLRNGAARLTRCSKILEHFRKAVLAAACSGKLTEDWRKVDPDLERASKLIQRIKQSHDTAGAGHGGKAADPTEDVHTLSADEFPDTWALEELNGSVNQVVPLRTASLSPARTSRAASHTFELLTFLKTG